MDNIKFINPNFTSHLGTVEVCEVNYNIRSLKMKDSSFIYVGEDKSENFDEIAMAMMLPNNEVISTVICGPAIGSGSKEVAERICKKLRKQVYVSFNVPDDRIIKPAVERKLFEEIKNKCDLF